MHSMLYLVLVMGLALIWRDRQQIHWKILWVVLLVGITQEVLQVIPYGTLPTLDAAFDILVDLMGGTIGLLLYAWIQRYRKVMRQLG